MKLGIVPENLVERLALLSGMLPPGIFECWFGIMLAQLMQRISRALRPGGIAAIWEPVRQDPSGKIRQIGGLLDLFFGFFSEAGAWSAAEVADWFQAAGLEAQRPRHPRMMPDLALYVGRKSA